VFAAIEEIAGQAADGEVGAPEQQEYDAGCRQKDTKEDQQFSEFGHRLIDTSPYAPLYVERCSIFADTRGTCSRFHDVR
jgi:hypothetical protein